MSGTHPGALLRRPCSNAAKVRMQLVWDAGEHPSGLQSSSYAPFRATQRLSTGPRPAEAPRD